MANVSQTTRKQRSIIEQFTSFTPDQPELESAGLTFIQNTFPLATGRYGPVKRLLAESLNTLKDLADVERVAGTVAGFRNLDTGRVQMFAGGVGPGAETLRLFLYDETTRLWSDVTRASGPYDFAPNRAVRFAAHGPDVFAAVGLSEPLQVIRIGEEDRFSDVAGAPQCTDIAVVREFLMAINFTRSGGLFADSVQWASQPDPRIWPAPGTPEASAVNSGLAQIPGGGRLQRIIAGVGGADAVIIAESRIWRVTFAGRPNIWQFDVAAYDQGTTVPGSVASTNESVFFMGRDGFQIFNGSTSAPIADGQVAETMLADPLFGAKTSSVNGFQDAIAAAIDLDRKLYLLSYRTDRGQDFEAILDSEGDPILTDLEEEILLFATVAGNNAIWAFNYASQAWGHACVECDALGTVDTNRTTLSTPRVVAIAANGALSRFDGATLEAIFEGPERLAKDGQQDTVFRILPGVDSDDAQAFLRVRNTLGVEPVKTPTRRLDNDGYAAVGEAGISARYWRVGLRIPAGDDWSFALGCQVELGDHGQGPVR